MRKGRIKIQIFFAFNRENMNIEKIGLILAARMFKAIFKLFSCVQAFVQSTSHTAISCIAEPKKIGKG